MKCGLRGPGSALPSSCLLAGLAQMAFSGKPGSPGIGKLVIPSVYISFSPWPLELHWKNQANSGLAVRNKSWQSIRPKYFTNLECGNSLGRATQHMHSLGVFEALSWGEQDYLFPWKENIRKSFPQNNPQNCTEIQFSYLLQLFQALRNVEGHIDQCSVSLILQNKNRNSQITGLVELVKSETGMNSSHFGLQFPHEREICNS